MMLEVSNMYVVVVCLFRHAIDESAKCVANFNVYSAGFCIVCSSVMCVVDPIDPPIILIAHMYKTPGPPQSWRFWSS